MDVGILVGGRSRRMGRPKGRLRAPGGGETLLERLVRVSREAGLVPVLLGDASPYADLVLDVPRLADAADAEGPLAGLAAFLAAPGPARRIVIACDMPFVEADTLRRLAAHASRATVLAARRSAEAPWEPWLARYDVARALPALRAAIARGERSPQRFFRTIDVDRFEPDDARALDDWDTPEDVER